jgi:serine/threonine-protein kinase ATR
VIDEAILERNRVYVVGVLKLISDKNVPHLHESCIAAWGQVGRVAPDEELNLVLLQLLEYLGHRNMIISASAFNEILALADARRMKTPDLFAPFWRTLGFTAIKDLVSKPQTSRMVAELLQTSVPELLLLVQSYAMPWLILTKKREVVLKLAEARGDKEPWMACIDGSNLGPILALLLVQDVPNLEEYCMSLFRHVSHHFDHVTLVELLGSEAAGTALELFKACGDADESRKPRIRAALSLMASLLLNDGGNRRKAHHLGRFFQQHALGLTSRFSEVITDSLQQNPPVQEQRRYIKGMEEMIRVCKAYVRIARPQISACLLSALGHDGLRSAAFSCWHVLLTYMEEEDVEALLETTFFIIDHFWQSFEDSNRQECVTLLNGLIDSYPELMARSINKLPSLSHIEGLASVNKALESMRTPLNSRQVFAIFAQRLDHENSGVVLQTLRELAGYLKKNQAYLQASAISDQPDSLVFTISRALLDCSAKYSGSHLEIARVCAECIGLVGCLDSNRIEAPREQRQFVVMDNFDSPGETTDFVVHLLENVLVKAFLSATDTRYIGFLSYTMQGLLERVDFKVAYAQQGAGPSLDLFRKWLAMSETSKEVLTPFLTSKYKLAPMVYPPVEYPIFRPMRGYGNWLRAFVLDLLNKGQNLFAQLIFEPLCRVIRVKDTAVAEFLLPYLVVHVVVGDGDQSGLLRQMVVNELLAILMYEPEEDASHLEKEDIKHCYEVSYATPHAVSPGAFLIVSGCVPCPRLCHALAPDH